MTTATLPKRRFKALTRDELDWLRADVERYHGGKQDGVAHSHTTCRLLDELDTANEWVRQALRDRQDALDRIRLRDIE